MFIFFTQDVSLFSFIFQIMSSNYVSYFKSSNYEFSADNFKLCVTVRDNSPCVNTAGYFLSINLKTSSLDIIVSG